MKNSSRFSYLLDKFVTNKITNEELQDFLALLDSDEIEEKFKQNLVLLWEQSRDKELLSGEKSRELFDKINQKKAAHLKVSKTVPSSPLFKWSVAAILLVSLIASYLYFSNKQQLEVNSSRDSVIAEIGEIKHFFLPDSSEVWLNSGSFISYDSRFEERALVLEGEAFFEVRRDSLRPFTVMSDDIVTRVLGTSFNIRSYQEDASVSVTVASGKVGVGKQHQSSTTIIPNQQLSYKKAEGEFSFSEVDASSLTSWKDGYLVFENITFQEAAITLEKHFGIQFQFQNPSLATCRFTSKFDQNESLDHVLEVLSKLNGISWERAQNKILFKGSNCL